MKFSQALESLELGKFIRRQCWPTGKYLWLKKGVSIKAEWCKDPILKDIATIYDGEVGGLPTICMKTDKAMIFTGWSPQAYELFTDDWETLD